LFSSTCQLQPFTALSSEFSLDGNAGTGPFNKGNLRAATALMNTLVCRTDGLRSDWVLDDAATTHINELAELNELAQQAVNALNP
jgi:hypothetical protein